MTNIKTAQVKPPAGFSTSSLPDLSKPAAPTAPGAASSQTPAAGGGGFNAGAFMGSDTGGASSGASSAFTPGQQTGGGGTSNAIKKMQAAILHFASVAASSEVTNMKDSGSGSDPFGDFLAERIGQSDNRPEENQQWVHIDLKQPQRSTTGIADSSLRGLIDDLKRVGTPGKENQPDGIWKGRTDHALKNIRLIVSELLSLSQDMQLPIPGLDEKSVEELKSSFYDEYTKIPPGKADEMANNLTPQINNFANVFASFKKTVLTNPAYKKYIDQNKSFIQYQQRAQSGDDTLTPEENKLYGSNVNAHVPNVMLGKSYVTLYDLNSMKGFKDLMTRAGLNPEDKSAVQNALNEIAKGLGVAGAPATLPANLDPGY